MHAVSKFLMASSMFLRARLVDPERLNKKVYVMMSRNCGKSDDYFSKLIHDKGHSDWFLDAEEAKNHGLINHIRMPELQISVKVDIDLA